MAKPKSKTQKKLDHAITLALTEVCETLLDKVAGFQWLTHQVDYARFPGSLIITCVFDTEAHLQAAQQEEGAYIRGLMQATLLKIGVTLPAVLKQVVFDSEEACAQQCESDWQRRLAWQLLKPPAKFH